MSPTATEEAREKARQAQRRNRDKALEVLEDYIPREDRGGIAIAARDVSVVFGGLTAVKNATIEVPTRSFVGLLGPNGAGKSTTFDVLNGLRIPSSGRVEMFGQDVTQKQAWDRSKLGMGRTFQSNRLNPSLTVRENLLTAGQIQIKGGIASAIFGLKKTRESERRVEEAAMALCILLGMDKFWDRRAGELDFGAQRRIEIANALMTGARLLLLDEPAAGLDAKETELLFGLIRRVQDDLKITILLVEHYVKAVLENADIVYVLSRGEVIAGGTPDEVTANERAQQDYFGMGNATEDTMVIAKEDIEQVGSANGNRHVEHIDVLPDPVDDEPVEARTEAEAQAEIDAEAEVEVEQEQEQEAPPRPRRQTTVRGSSPRSTNGTPGRSTRSASTNGSSARSTGSTGATRKRASGTSSTTGTGRPASGTRRKSSASTEADDSGLTAAEIKELLELRRQLAQLDTAERTQPRAPRQSGRSKTRRSDDA